MYHMAIFTDASIIKTSYGETIGCAGAICKENNNICKFEIQRDSTNNISEMTAIYLALQLALEHRELLKVKKVDIYADSQWAIYSLTKWIRGWMNNIQNGIMINSSGMPVKNQELILSIIKLIVDNDLPVTFYHVKGHVNVHDIKSVEHALSVFSKSNGVLVFNKNNIVDCANMNNMVDKQTRDLLDAYRDATPVHLTRGVVLPVISNQDLIRYYNLVTLGGNPI